MPRSRPARRPGSTSAAAAAGRRPGVRARRGEGGLGLRVQQPPLRPVRLEESRRLGPEERAGALQGVGGVAGGRLYKERSRTHYAVKVEPRRLLPGGRRAGRHLRPDPLGERAAGRQPVRHRGRPARLGDPAGCRVPEMPGGRTDEPLDVGTLELAMAQRVKPGESAPAFRGGDARRRGPEPGRPQGEVRPPRLLGHLVRPLRRGDPLPEGRVRRLRPGRPLRDGRPEPGPGQGRAEGVRREERPGLAPGVPWPRLEVATEYGVRGIPSIWLIGPDGKVVAKDLRGDAIKDALAKRLRSHPVTANPAIGAVHGGVASTELAPSPRPTPPGKAK